MVGFATSELVRRKAGAGIWRSLSSSEIRLLDAGAEQKNARCWRDCRRGERRAVGSHQNGFEWVLH